MDSSAQSVAEWAGMSGAAVFLASFAFMQLGMIRGQSYLFAGLILLAVILMLFSVRARLDPAAMGFFLAIAATCLAGIVRLWLRDWRPQFTDEERRFLSLHLPDLPAAQARDLLSASSWCRMAPGRVLVAQGDAPADLIFIARGRARLLVAGHVVGICGAGALIGELSLAGDLPASATVEATEITTCMVFDAQKLTRIVSRDDIIREHLSACVFDNGRDSLLGLPQGLAQAHVR